jgi:hypothetical protein
MILFLWGVALGIVLGASMLCFLVYWFMWRVPGWKR